MQAHVLICLVDYTRWGQTYILEALMYYVPEQEHDAELLAERIAIRLQHSNSAVVLTTIKVILYLMNYMGSKSAVDNMCRKLSPPLGKSSPDSCRVPQELTCLDLSDAIVLRL